MKRKCLYDRIIVSKRHKTHLGPRQVDGQFQHPVLSRYYDNTQRLRDYLKAKLITRSSNDLAVVRINAKSENDTFDNFLDSVVICFDNEIEKQSLSARRRELNEFSGLAKSYRPYVLDENNLKSWQQRDLVNFCIWREFRKTSRPNHLLCQGFQRARISVEDEFSQQYNDMIGLLTLFPNQHVETLSSPYWINLLALLGKDGASIIIDMLMDCDIFVSTGGKFCQISGIPLSEKAMSHSTKDVPILSRSNSKNSAIADKPRNPYEIRFVRNRMLYSRPTLNAQGKTRLGFRHIHVLNRLGKLDNQEETIHFAKHVFPLQFGLHNVFTSTVNRKATTYQFLDYMLRETEISRAAKVFPKSTKLPKRFRGPILEMLNSIRRNHFRISYVELLNHHCPTPHTVAQFLHQTDNGSQSSSTQLATKQSQVHLFCKSVLSRLIGSKQLGNYNWRVFLRKMRQFFHLRKYENMSLGDVLDGMKVTDIAWLIPPKLSAQKMSKSDFEKRKQLLAEFMYYVFDSLIIPLIKSCFHVTESNADKTKIFFFRLDVWRQISEPAFNEIKLKSFEELSMDSAKSQLANRSLSYSHMRLLPKAKGFRPIINLKRKPLAFRSERATLGQSINTLMTPAYHALRYEMNRRPQKMKSSLFSVSEIYPALTKFHRRLSEMGLDSSPLYFATVDVKSCFDTIPAKNVLNLIKQYLTSSEYSITRYARIRRPTVISRPGHLPALKSRIKFDAEGNSVDESNHQHLDNKSEQQNTIIVKPVGYRQQKSQLQIIRLLEEHLLGNIVIIGRKFYRQKVGIPQGSVVSTILCTLFYSQLEQVDLDFLDRPDTLLLRLIDDFLVISTDRKIVVQFLNSMHKGIPEFGITVNPSKSLTNFDTTTEGFVVPKIVETGFPYCGLLINTQNLSVSKDMRRLEPSGIPDGLTVESSVTPGISFRQKSVNGTRIHLQPILFDTKLTRLPTVLSNVYNVFNHAAYRVFYYSRALGKKRPHATLIISTVNDLISLVTSSVQRANASGKKNVISTTWIRYLALEAFQTVLEARATSYVDVLAWINREEEKVRPKGKTARRLVYKAIGSTVHL